MPVVNERREKEKNRGERREVSDREGRRERRDKGSFAVHCFAFVQTNITNPYSEIAQLVG